MTFNEIFAAYYTQYRGEAQIPDSTDDEYIVALELANEAINHWKNYDATYWNELWTTHTADGTGDQTLAANTTEYTLSTAMREIGGDVRVKDSDGKLLKTYKLIEPHEKQFQSTEGSYCWLTGYPGNFVLNLNKAPDTSLVGQNFDFDFYKEPTEFTTGTDTTEMSNPYFIVHHILANRFRASRNWTAYQTAKRDSENALKVMQMDNNSGSWSNPWKVADNSGSSFGV